MQYSLISKLSGGEKRRLYLLKVLMEAPNILILDEPTNDLDIQTLTILEDYLDTYDGIVVTVSHDRYFLDRVVERIFAFEGDGKITQYEGGFSDYKNSREDQGLTDDISGNNGLKQEDKKETNTGRTKPKEEKLKFSYNEKREYDEIDNTIAELETKLEKIELEITDASSNYSKLNELMAQKEETEKALEEKMDRWVYLNDLAEQIENAKSK
jgi:ATP-binding cassette subfamily F protein uup